MPSEIFGDLPDAETINRMSDECSKYYQQLIAQGIDETLAMDRVFDCFDVAIDPNSHGLLFMDDQPLLERLNQIKKEGTMPNINIPKTDQIGDAGGSFKKLEPGAYVVRVVQCNWKADKEYFELVYDIAEGPQAGYYSDAWGVEHPYAHRIVMSYKETALNMLAGRFNAIDASNPGFSSEAAFKADRFDFFVGRIFGVNLQEEEYQKADGTIGVRLNACQLVQAQDVRDGKVKPRDKKALKQPAGAAPQTPSFDVAFAQNVDVPFA